MFFLAFIVVVFVVVFVGGGGGGKGDSDSDSVGGVNGSAIRVRIQLNESKSDMCALRQSSFIRALYLTIMIAGFCEYFFFFLRICVPFVCYYCCGCRRYS